MTTIRLSGEVDQSNSVNNKRYYNSLNYRIMFTNNFFYDNSQLNYGKHLSKDQNLNREEKNVLRKVLTSVKKIRIATYKKQNEQFKMLRSLGLLIAMLLVIFAFEWKTYDKNEVVTLETIHLEGQEVLDIPMTEQAPPPAPKKMAIKIIEVADIEEVEEEIDIDLDIETNELMIIEEVAHIEVGIDDVEEEEVEEIFIIVEKAPLPVGGFKEFYKYLNKEITYPGAARRAGISGKVFVQFVVNKDGSLTDFAVIKGVGLGCDKEAIRVLKKAPNWVPGKQRGKEVRVRMVLPINFILKER